MTGVAPVRLHALDGLRGLAVLGILLMNVNAFALPFAAYDDPAAYGPMGPLDLTLWAAEYLLVDGKFRALFSALFGASLWLAADRAEAAGRPAGAAGRTRLATLLGFGLAHACLLWSGDILVLYALVGFVALPLRRLPVERLLVLAGLLVVAQAAIQAVHYQALAALQAAAAAPGAAPADRAAWAATRGLLRPGTAALAAEVGLHHGPWWAGVTARAAAEPATVGAELWLAGPETLALMLTGMAALRWAAADGGAVGGIGAGRDRLRRLARPLYAAGLLCLLPPLLLLLRWRFPPLATAVLTDLGALPGRWLVAAGHAALLLAWLAGPATPLKRRLAAAGRVAFSNYLGTSLLMVALFDGLGLFGRLDRWQLLAPVAAAWVLMLAWSAPWLATHAHGPTEWLWRGLARGRPARWRRVDG